MSAPSSPLSPVPSDFDADEHDTTWLDSAFDNDDDDDDDVFTSPMNNVRASPFPVMKRSVSPSPPGQSKPEVVDAFPALRTEHQDLDVVTYLPIEASSAESMAQGDGIPEVMPQEQTLSPSLVAPTEQDNELGATRTSARKRVAPTRLEEEMEEPKLKKTIAPAATRKRAPARGSNDPDFLMTNPKSKFATMDLIGYLTSESAWSVLNREERLQIIALLPGGDRLPDFPEDMEIPNLPQQALKSNSAFRADVRLFQEDLAAGRYEKQWLEDAKLASEERASGKFDDWKEKNREDFWGQKQKATWGANAGESSQHSLSALVAAGCFEVGDVWLLTRGYRPGGVGNNITVEKEAKITRVAFSRFLEFTFPPGQHKFSSPANGEDISVKQITGPKELSDAILAEDGRITNVRGANSWREFRCFRNNQDIGGLWDVRELHHARLHANKASKGGA